MMIVGIYKVLTWVSMNLSQEVYLHVKFFGLLEEIINSKLVIGFFLSNEFLPKFMNPWLCVIPPLGLLGRETQVYGSYGILLLFYLVFILLKIP
jgi:hypothetical protein